MKANLNNPVDLEAQIAHLLLTDVVGYSKLLINDQVELLQELDEIVRATKCFRAAEASGQLVRVAMGDGAALLFFRSPEEPVHCALEISQALQSHPHIQLRMGAHSGPVNRRIDLNDQPNVVGAGINFAQRVMDCGDAGHILLSRHLVDNLAEYRHWQPYLHDLGQCEVKHGQKIRIFNLHKNGFGNPAVPQKLKCAKSWKWLGGFGRTASQGPAGPTGAKGDKGDKGDSGATGKQGPKGNIRGVGPVGPKTR